MPTVKADVLMKINEKRYIKRLISVVMTAVTIISASVSLSVRADEASVTNLPDCKSKVTKVIPGGMPFGVKLDVGGVLVVRLSQPSETQKSCPAADAGIKVGDVIESVDGKNISSFEDLVSAVDASNGKTLNIGILRDEKRMTLSLTPVPVDDGAHYKAGVWVRDRASGIGTITFITEEDHRFAGLGHGICDPDSGAIMPMSKASVYFASIVAVRKGKNGSPGELRGYFNGSKCGALLSNTDCGTFGLISTMPEGVTHKAVEIADADEVSCGEAYILCTLDGCKVGRYSVNISKIVDRERDVKNFVIEVTDKELLEKTGGIVRGMSGSPIIKDGKLVGAITHVFVSDCKKGYGIFTENMLRKMDNAG